MANSLVDSLLKVCEKMTNLVYLNMLWLGFSLLGFVVLGVSPATTAVIHIMRKQRQQPNSQLALLKEFKTIYRARFIESNKIGLLLIVVLIGLLVSGIVMAETNAPFLFKSMFIFSLSGFMLITLLAFPIHERKQTGPLYTTQLALFLGLSHLPYLLLTVVALIVVVVLFGRFPLMMLFFSASLPLAIVVSLSERLLNRYDLGVDEK